MQMNLQELCMWFCGGGGEGGEGGGGGVEPTMEGNGSRVLAAPV